MKKLFIGIAVCLLSMAPFAVLSQPYGNVPVPDEKQSTQRYIAKCPQNGLTNDILKCTTCHSLDRWKLKEIYPSDFYAHPDWIIERDGQKRGYFLLESVHSADMKRFFDYMEYHNINDVAVEIQSFGGRLDDMWRIVGFFEAWKKKGGIVRTEVHGVAFSAGFLIFVSGSRGYRTVNRTAELMWHELQAWTDRGIQTPSSKEDEALVLRHLQDTTNNWIASRGKLTKAELDEKIKRKEYWMNGAEVVELGFADGFIGESEKGEWDEIHDILLMFPKGPDSQNLDE